MHQAHRARRPHARLGRCQGRLGHPVRDRAREHALVPEAVDGAPVRARENLQRPVLLGDLVHHQERRDHIVVAVRREREVLVPLDLGVPARELGVDLGVVQLHVRPDQLGHAVGHAALQRGRQIGLRYLHRRIDPAEARLRAAVAGLEVEARAAVHGIPPGGGVRPALLHPGIEVLLQPREQGAIHRILDHQIAVLVEERALIGAKLGHGRSGASGGRRAHVREAAGIAKLCVFVPLAQAVLEPAASIARTSWADGRPLTRTLRTIWRRCA